MIDGFIKNHELLEEKSNVPDLLGCEPACAMFAKKLDSLTKSSVVALVGPFGSGKSTMLHQIMTQRSEKELCIEFDAWKYPDRKDLWEGFVLDLAKCIGPKIKAETENKIKGTIHNDVKALINTVSGIFGLSFIKGLNHFFERSPAKRVDDIQDILAKCINNCEKEILVIVEDIDRSGDSGVFFLETLKQFIRCAVLNKKITIIVPISNASYYNKLDSYLKCIDYFEFFIQNEIKLSKFVDEVFDESNFVGELRRQMDINPRWTGAKRRLQAISFMEGLFREMPEMNMRLLKLIIRKANVVYKNQKLDGHDPDFRMTLCVEAAKYFKTGNTSKDTYFDAFKSKWMISKGNIFASFIGSMISNGDSVYEVVRGDNPEKTSLLSLPYDIKLATRKNDNKNDCPSYPWEYGAEWRENKGYAVADFYMEY